MRQVQAVLAGLIVGLGLAEFSFADEPAKTPASVKPPWQRLLQGEDARTAAAQTRQLVPLRTAGKFEEALKVAQALAELRSKAQGADHWEAVDACWGVQALRRLLRQNERGRADYVRSFP